MTSVQAEIGIFGGSGFYQLLDDAETVQVETPYGLTSADVTLGTIAGRRVAFIPRHGDNHRLPPHLINYRANVWAFKKLGVTRVVSPCAAGSLQNTSARVRLSSATNMWTAPTPARTRSTTARSSPMSARQTPTAREMRKYAIKAAQATNLEFEPEGTIVVIQGPRFSTRAESNWFRTQGWEVINMTQYPEVHLIRELEMCVANISLITDYDTGIPGVEPVSHEDVLKVFSENNDKLKVVAVQLHRKPAHRAQILRLRRSPRQRPRLERYPMPFSGSNIFLILAQIVNLVMVLLFIRIIMSWVAPRANWYKQPFKLLYDITEPIMAPFRRIIPPMGGLDLSPMLMFFLLSLLAQF